MKAIRFFPWFLMLWTCGGTAAPSVDTGIEITFDLVSEITAITDTDIFTPPMDIPHLSYDESTIEIKAAEGEIFEIEEVSDLLEDLYFENVLEEEQIKPSPCDFSLDVGDPAGYMLHGTIWPPHHAPSPLVILVHGIGCVRYVWSYYFDVVDPLLDAGFTVAAYDQRGHGESRDLEFDLEQMARDVGRVIAFLDENYSNGQKPWIDKNRPIGLIGHSLGAYIVTIATCQNLGYLGDQIDRVGVVVEGAGPDNLPEVKEYLDSKEGLNFLIDFMIMGLAAYQPEGDWSDWWQEWASTGLGAYDELLAAIYTAQNPIGYGHGDGVNTLDNADFILKPFYVVHSLADTTVPAVPPTSCASHLYNDVTFNSGGPLGTWIKVNNATDYHTYSLVGHDIYKDKGVVEWVINKLKLHLLY